MEGMKYRARRKHSDFGAEIHTEAGVLAARIIDITQEGARLRMPRSVYARDVDVKVMIRSTPHPAELIWQQNGDVGVKFDKPLCGDDVNAVLRRLRNPNAGRKHRFVMS